MSDRAHPAPVPDGPEAQLRILRFLPSTTAEGPGRRAALWVQGCSIRCPGCFNRHSWPERGGTLVGWAALAERIVAVDGIEGLTLLGGEPFDQAAPVARLAEAVRARGLGVMTFTGYTLEALRGAGRPEHEALLAATDLLVDGPYLADRPERRRPWVGSSNQRFHFLTARYAALEAEWEAIPNRLEVRIRRDGLTQVNGFAPVDRLEALLDADLPRWRAPVDGP